MLKSHLLILGLSIAIILLALAVKQYPGGSAFNKHSVGFDFQNNYLCNLFDAKAENAADNPARFYAIPGMFFLCFSFAIFFWNISKKIPVKIVSNIIRFCGVIAMILGFLIVTPYHDEMLTIAGAFALMSIGCVVIFIFRSKLVVFKILSLCCVTLFFACNFIYYSKIQLAWLPILQKISLVVATVWMLGLNYFTSANDFIANKKD